MRRKEQDARIEQQKQEKERAREDAARERARSVPPGSQSESHIFFGLSNVALIVLHVQ